MPGFLKQSTGSQVIELGPFLDDTDFKSPETGLTINNTDIKLRKASTSHANKNSGGGTHIANGYYYATLDSTDTATVGILDVHVNVSGALPIFDRYYVLEEAVYDELFGAGATGLMAAIVEGAYTVKQFLRLMGAALLGKASGLATSSVNYRDTGDSKNRIAATVDADGNRSSVTLDAS